MGEIIQVNFYNYEVLKIITMGELVTSVYDHYGGCTEAHMELCQFMQEAVEHGFLISSKAKVSTLVLKQVLIPNRVWRKHAFAIDLIKAVDKGLSHHDFVLVGPDDDYVVSLKIKSDRGGYIAGIRKDGSLDIFRGIFTDLPIQLDDNGHIVTHYK